MCPLWTKWVSDDPAWSFNTHLFVHETVSDFRKFSSFQSVFILRTCLSVRRYAAELSLEHACDRWSGITCLFLDVFKVHAYYFVLKVVIWIALQTSAYQVTQLSTLVLYLHDFNIFKPSVIWLQLVWCMTHTHKRTHCLCGCLVIESQLWKLMVCLSEILLERGKALETLNILHSQNRALIRT